MGERFRTPGQCRPGPPPHDGPLHTEGPVACRRASGGEGDAVDVTAFGIPPGADEVLRFSGAEFSGLAPEAYAAASERGGITWLP